MSRGVFVSAGGDPFILLMVHRLFRERWYDEVDNFWVCYNNHSQVPKGVSKELFDRLLEDPKVRMIYHPVGIGNGRPITEMTLISQDDMVMLLEDDFFIFNPGQVDKYFKMVENGECDVVGSPRYAAGEVAEAAQKKYNLDYSGYGDRGFGWWPTGFFCKRSDLMKTDLDFGSNEYPAGEYFKELDHTFKDTCYTDTFTWASIQLRYLGLKSFDVPQYHADPYELENKERHSGNWVGEAPKWLHAGSLSAGWGGYLSGKEPALDNDSAIREMETRCAFWTICSDIEGFDDFKRQYKEGIDNLATKLDQGRINDKIKLYKEMLCLM